VAVPVLYTQYMPSKSGLSADDEMAALTHEERASAAARAVEPVALTLAAEQ